MILVLLMTSPDRFQLVDDSGGEERSETGGLTGVGTVDLDLWSRTDSGRCPTELLLSLSCGMIITVTLTGF
jgi:hypothetical protein